jgi:hypothetical protein
MLINEQTRDFIRQHENDDVRRLALQGTKDPEVDLMVALQQIAGRQTARKKLPSWAAVDGVFYPPHLNMEQCSSEQTARYKASLLRGGQRYVDLTGGFGVDFYWMSQGFQHRFYIERDEALCAIAEHNFRLLGLPCSVCCCNTATYLTEMEHADVVFLDPARRDEKGARTFGIEDCTPNVLELLPLLRMKADTIVLKLSPMLDWRKAVSDLQCVSEVHIVSVDNECKELLLILKNETCENLRLVCMNNDSVFEIVRPLRTASPLPTDHKFAPYGLKMPPSDADASLYLYEPNASIMKAGCFEALEERFPVSQVSPNSHLFLSADEIRHFPGRAFQILATSSMNKKELKPALATISQANIAVRNFPLTAQQLRQKLKLRDGGDVYIFATTTADGAHKLFICRKIG